MTHCHQPSLPPPPVGSLMRFPLIFASPPGHMTVIAGGDEKVGGRHLEKGLVTMTMCH